MTTFHIIILLAYLLVVQVGENGNGKCQFILDSNASRKWH